MIYYILSFIMGVAGIYYYYRRRKLKALENQKKNYIPPYIPSQTINLNNNDNPVNEPPVIQNLSNVKTTFFFLKKEFSFFSKGTPTRKGEQKCRMIALKGSKLSITEGKIVQNNTNYNYNHARGDVGIMGGGKWYYEMTLESNGQILIGWATEDWKLNQNSSVGLGNDSNSWGYDGYYGSSWNCGKNQTYGRNYW